MPRDCALPALPMVDLAGGRKARIIDGERAGETRLLVNNAITELADQGLLDVPQTEAARYLAALVEMTSLRQRLGCSFEPHVDADADGFGLERLTRQQFKAWKRLGQILAAVPTHCRAALDATVLHDLPPAATAIPRLRVALDRIARAAGLRTR